MRLIRMTGKAGDLLKITNVKGLHRRSVSICEEKQYQWVLYDMRGGRPCAWCGKCGARIESDSMEMLKSFRLCLFCGAITDGVETRLFEEIMKKETEE